MALNPTQHDTLFKAFGLFIEEMRPYIAETLRRSLGDAWAEKFRDGLSPQQAEKFRLGLQSGSEPESLIDYQYLRSFALGYKHLIKDDFGRDVNKLATWCETLASTRNKLAHFAEIASDEYTEAFITMKNIARALDWKDTEKDLQRLQDMGTSPDAAPSQASAGKVSASVASPSVASQPVASQQVVSQSGGEVKAWFNTVTPHSDIQRGTPDESVFAANLAEVALGNGREMYSNPVVFFSKTYFTAGLKSIARTVVQALGGVGDAENRIISLQTGFGGGKTHSLISLYHLCTIGNRAETFPALRELTDYTGVPTFTKANVAVFTNATNDPANGRTVEEGLTIRTLWGELAYQLGGKAAYEIIRKNDEERTAPAGLFKRVLEGHTPALLLIDELADYCVKASAQITGKSSLADQTISFMQELTEAVAQVKGCVAVITLPASEQEVGNTPEAQSILNSLQKRVSRVGADTKPVADEEIYEVIRRRLFENVGSGETVAAVAARYVELYERNWTELPDYAPKSEYKQRLLKSYPFHPELIDIFRVRWASNHDFQRTRGVLRLLAAIVGDLWQHRRNLPGENLLIHTGDVNLERIDALVGQMKRLYGNGYEAVITADVAGASSNARKIDNAKKEFGDLYLAEAVSASVLLASFGGRSAHNGLSMKELKLHLMTPQGFNHNVVNSVVDEMERSAYYLYNATGGGDKRYWFHTKPNINILINQNKDDITSEAVNAEIVRRIRETTRSGGVFNVLVEPAEDMPEQLRPTLLVLSPAYQVSAGDITGNLKSLIEKIATRRGNNERLYRNTILFLLPSESGVQHLQTHIKEYLACQKVLGDYASQLERDQKGDIERKRDEFSKKAESSLTAAYSVVAKHSAKGGIARLHIKEFASSIGDQIRSNLVNILRDEEWILDSVGERTLQNANLLPTPEKPVRVKDVVEAFLRFDDKPMITSENAVKSSLERYCENGRFCIAAGDGTTFSRIYFQESVPSFTVTDEVFWLLDKSAYQESKKSEELTGKKITDEPNGAATDGEPPSTSSTRDDERPQDKTRTLKTISVSGKVPVDQYSQLFQSFILPLAQNGIEIEIRIKGKSTLAKPLTETSQEYKIVKESAKQLGLNFEEEE